MNRRVREIALGGLLAAMMLVLGWVESMIPLGLGVPGIRLGLSNGVLIFAVYMLGIPMAFCLMALKVLLSGLLFGGVPAMLYAMSGGLLSMLGMSLLSRFRRMPVIAVSMAGGVLHNAGQVLMAIAVLQTAGLWGYMGVLMLAGLICGLLTGICADRVLRHLKKSRLFTAGKEQRNAWLPILLALVVMAVTAWMAIQATPSLRTLFTGAPAPVVEWDDGPAGMPSVGMPNLPLPKGLPQNE